MKPFFISLFVMFCLPLLTGAQTIHGIIFAATDDPKIGEGMKRDHDRALEEINDIGAYIGYKTVIYDFPGSKCKKQNLMNVLNSMNTGKDDIVVFYKDSSMYIRKNGGKKLVPLTLRDIFFLNRNYGDLCTSFFTLLFSDYENRYIAKDIIREIIFIVIYFLI